MPNTYVALRTETVAVATNSVTLSLSGISGYTDLVLVINNTHSTNAVDGWFRLNGDTGSNYSRTNLNGDGTSATSGRNSNVAFGYGILVLTTPSTNILQFMNYANTTTNKTVLMRSNNTGSGGYVQATVDLWRSTAAITSIEIGCVSGNFAVGSTLTSTALQMPIRELPKQPAVSSQRIQHTGTTPSVHQVPLFLSSL